MTDALCHLVVDGNDVMEFKLIRTPEDIEDDEVAFEPEMCHQVFGAKENIFGYTGLQIKLYYSAASLMTYLGIEYTDKIDPKKSDGLKADDVEGSLRKVLAPGYFTNIDQFVSKLEQDYKFRPFGRLVHCFSHSIEETNDRINYEIYYCETSTAGFVAYHQHLQTFLLWYVDGASFIDVDDDQWTFFLVFEKYLSSEGDTRYATAGYATVYRYYAYPAHTRPRISQVLVMPPHRRRGICAQMLQAIYSQYVSQSQVIDLTVEDPSIDFQCVRDYVDANNCSSLPAFSVDKLREGFSTEMIKEAQSKLKINKLQCRRVYEILRLRHTSRADERAYRQYRLTIKNRLNAPFQKKKLEMKKLAKVLSAEEFAATASTTREHDTYDRLTRQYRALEDDYTRVINRLDRD